MFQSVLSSSTVLSSRSNFAWSIHRCRRRKLEMLPPTRLHEPPPPSPCLLPSNTPFNFLSLKRPNSGLPYYSARSVSRIALKSNGFRSFSHAPASNPADEAEEEKTDFAKLKEKIEALGVKFESCTPGLYDLLYCPKCKGGRSIQRTLSFHISQSWSFAMWRCFDLQCGWAGQVFADNEKANHRANIYGKVNSFHTASGESLKLEPLDDVLLEYFAERMISKETLQRNNVMQVAGGKKIIAFPYRRNGQLVGCKYRTLEKRFWQGKNTEKMLYGLDDIADADEIIIVEGEIDKLSLEEAGYCNCVSVPGGAPQMVSIKEIPPQEKDTGFQYLWNCKDYFEKASRIILATDGDTPGRALAEELARRLGKERCRHVRWPRKDGVSTLKDANEVLKSLGADALRDAIDKAELYQMQNLE